MLVTTRRVQRRFQVVLVLAKILSFQELASELNRTWTHAPKMNALRLRRMESSELFVAKFYLKAAASSTNKVGCTPTPKKTEACKQIFAKNIVDVYHRHVAWKVLVTN